MIDPKKITALIAKIDAVLKEVRETKIQLQKQQSYLS